MKLPKFADTLSFKLSTLYLSLFLVSFLAIGTSVYWLTHHSLERQLKISIETEALRLKTEYDEGGLSELKVELKEVDDPGSYAQFEYGLIDQNGIPIIGHLTNFQPTAGWQMVLRSSSTNTGNKEEKTLHFILVTALSNNLWLGSVDVLPIR